MTISEISAQLAIRDIEGSVWLTWSGAGRSKRTFSVVMDADSLEALHRALATRQVRWVKEDRTLGVIRSRGRLTLFFQMRQHPYPILNLRLTEDESDRFIAAVRKRVRVED